MEGRDNIVQFKPYPRTASFNYPGAKSNKKCFDPPPLQRGRNRRFVDSFPGPVCAKFQDLFFIR